MTQEKLVDELKQLNEHSTAAVEAPGAAEPVRRIQAREITWGNVAQWVSAIGTALAVTIAGVGLHSAQPLFQNQRLQEDNARLDLEIRESRKRLAEMELSFADARGRSWAVACQLYVSWANESFEGELARWRGAIEFLKALPPAFSAEAGLGDAYNRSFIHGNALEWMETVLGSVDISFLLDPDRERFLALARQFIFQHREAFDLPFLTVISSNALPQQAVDQSKAWVAKIQSLQAVFAPFAEECEKAKP